MLPVLLWLLELSLTKEGMNVLPQGLSSKLVTTGSVYPSLPT